MSYSFATYSNVSLSQRLGNLMIVAHPQLRLTMNFTNAVIDKFAPYSIANLSTKGLSGLSSSQIS